ncbi:MAG: glycoside hydrolase family 78 protein [bacterium]|nr:glycoside hydrolase family 78 protein [bacterium]
MKAVHLRTEYLKEPLGMSIFIPRFYWECEGGKKQTAYRIIVKVGEKVRWDSGVVESSAMAHVRYEGKYFSARQHATWGVRLRDENGQWGELSTSWFEMGLYGDREWKAHWISGNYVPRKRVHYPVDCFRKEFRLRPGISGARIFATAKGVYDLTLNGVRVEDFILAPGITDYRKLYQAQSYDVTDLLKEDAVNCWEIRTADGWYRGSCGSYGMMNVYGVRTAVRAQLEVFYEDGTGQMICTDSGFSWSNDGPLRFADLKDGEIYDAGKKPSYAGKVRVYKQGKDDHRYPKGSDNVAVKEHERFGAKLTGKDGVKVYDFGQNIAGYLEFTVRGEEGQQFTLVCGEKLDQNGHVDLSGVQERKPEAGWTKGKLLKKLLGKEIGGKTVPTPLQEIRFTCSGGEDYYKTSFALFGFRYAELIGDVGPAPENITAIAVYSDLEETGSFSCSNELVNRLYQNSLWSMKGNYLDIPSGSAVRDRLGRTGDVQIFFDTAAYMMNVAPFFHKWMRDTDCVQDKNGLLPAAFPYTGLERMYRRVGASVGWADIAYLVLYRYYKRYRDIRFLETYYFTMKDYTDHLIKNLGMTDRKEARENPYNEFTYEKGMHLGDRQEPEELMKAARGKKKKYPEECTAYLYLAMRTMEEICQILDRYDGTRDRYKIYAEVCRKYAEGSKKAYRYLYEKEGNFETRCQDKLVRPLAFGLFDGEDRRRVQEQLVRVVEENDYRVGTGFLTTAYLLPVLTEAGRTDIAYKVLENTEKPGWLAEVLDGATTVWETWEGDRSLNHCASGAVCQWLFETVGGIHVDGENRFLLTPEPGGSLTHADVSYRSVFGTVRVYWEKEESGRFAYQISVPSNTRARLVLPDGREELLEAGEYRF